MGPTTGLERVDHLAERRVRERAVDQMRHDVLSGPRRRLQPDQGRLDGRGVAGPLQLRELSAFSPVFDTLANGTNVTVRVNKD